MRTVYDPGLQQVRLPNVHAFVRVGRMLLSDRGCLLGWSDAGVQHVWLPDLYLGVYLGHLFLSFRRGLCTEHQVGVRELRHLDVRPVRSVGCVRGSGRLCRGDLAGLR